MPLSYDDSNAPNENSCIDELLGAWQVTGFIPSSANSMELKIVQKGAGSADNILSLSIVDDAETINGMGWSIRIVLR